MKEKNSIIIQGWMIKQFNLKANDLIVYALIYGFSQTEGNTFNGNLKYIKDFINVNSKSTVLKILNSLIDKKLIFAYTEIENGKTIYKYRANLSLVHKETECSKNEQQEQKDSKNEHACSKNEQNRSKNGMTENNNTNNIDNNIVFEQTDYENYKQYTIEQFKEAIRTANAKLERPLHTDSLRKFFNYWSETTSKGIMRFKLEKTWKTGNRLSYWRNNEKQPFKEQSSARNLLN